VKRPLRRRKAAATADVLNSTVKEAQVPRRWKQHYRHLTQLRELLLAERGDQARDAIQELPAFSMHMADAGTDNFNRDLALSRISAEQDALYEIDDALIRIRDGTYGICQLTGKPIERERLEAIPWTRFSAAAEKQLEKDGTVRRARLAPAETVSRSAARRNESEANAETEEESD